MKFENKNTSIIALKDEIGDIWYYRKKYEGESFNDSWTLHFNQAKTFDSDKDWKKIMKIIDGLCDFYEPSRIILMDIDVQGLTMDEFNYIYSDREFE